MLRTAVDSLFFARSSNRNGKKEDNETWKLLMLRRGNHRPMTRNTDGECKEWDAVDSQRYKPSGSRQNLTLFFA